MDPQHRRAVNLLQLIAGLDEFAHIRGTVLVTISHSPGNRINDDQIKFAHFRNGVG